MKNKTVPFQNYLHNREQTLQSCVLPQGTAKLRATDEQGFIVEQRLLDAYWMAYVPSGSYGCGWIACYNALRLLGKPQSAARVIRRLEKSFVLAGHMGTSAAGVAAFFIGQGYRVRLSLTIGEVNAVARAAKANIVFYIRGPKRGAHFVVFSPAGCDAQGVPLYRFYNSGRVPAAPCAPPANEKGEWLCAGGSRGDVRRYEALLKPEKPIFALVLSIFG